MTVDGLIDILATMKAHKQISGEDEIKVSGHKSIKRVTGVMYSEQSNTVYLVKEGVLYDSD